MRANKYYLLFIILVLVVSGFQGLEEPAFLKRLKQELQRYHDRYPEEKVYLHFDKPFYKPGDDIWFNASILNANTHRPTSLSDVVYVELIDPKGNVSSRLELVIQEGTAHGDFALQTSAPGGLYRIEAYTQWMKNFGRDNVFKKEIPVQRIITPRLLLKLDFEKESYGPADRVQATLSVRDLKNERVRDAEVHYTINIAGQKIHSSTARTNADGDAPLAFTLPEELNSTDGLLVARIEAAGVEESISRSVPIVLDKISISFFPEGGHWIENAESRIAFKALNEFGKGADISGFVVDELGKKVASFESFHMGMGAFHLKPARGKKYFAQIVKPSGNESLTPLPDPLTEGYNVTLKRRTGSLTTWIVRSPTANPGYFVARLHGELVYGEALNLKKGENTIQVSTKDFGTGIAVFTLFDALGAEQCERLVFVNAENQLRIRVTPDKSIYQPGEKVELAIQTTDFGGAPVSAKISLSVADDQLITFADDMQDNILSSFLLSSELRGEIQEPSFYFDPDEEKAVEALDYLLLTQGWRRFSWREVSEAERSITHLPEKVKNISGTIVNKNKQGISSEVTLLEMGNQKRVLTLKTTKEGHFTFRNVDPTVPLLLLTKRPGNISLQKVKHFAVSFNDKDGTVWLPEITQESAVGAVVKPIAPGHELETEMNLSMDEDISSLSEIVVTGFGVEEKKSITGSVATIVTHDNPINSSLPAFESALQGRIAGVHVRPQYGNPAAQFNLAIRGISSLASGGGEPLYVIDGNPIGSSLSQNFSNGSMLSSQDIVTMGVISSPEASALWGSAAANGVVLITTRNRIGYRYFQSKRTDQRFSSQTIQPRKFSVTRQFYIPPPAKKQMNKREDFRSTIYWNPSVVTDKNGKARVRFYNNDAVSAFRATAEGFTGQGDIGRTETVFTTKLPFSIDTKMPAYLGFEDVLRLPVSVRNETTSELSGTLTLDVPTGLLLREAAVSRVTVPAGVSKIFWFTITPKALEGEFPLNIRLASERFEDEFKQIIRVQPVGFPVKVSFSGKDLEKDFRFEVHEAERGSVKAELTAYPDVLADLFSGAESILQEPHGCFEQVSSSNFPNILALQYLRQSETISPETEKLALRYIQDGYRKLMAYEIAGGGFEWFGHPPAHEGLTAYGLLQFYEMRKIYPKVDEQMMDRTRSWLLGRRDGKGGFRQHAGMDGFSHVSADVSNAYIVFALAETGTKDIQEEYHHAFSEALKSQDFYRMALMANASYKLGRMDDYRKLTEIFQAATSAGEYSKLKVAHSIVHSYGSSLLTETLSLWAIALMKAKDADFKIVQSCIREISRKRAFGGFGSTQATAFALKALTEYSRLVRSAAEDGQIRVLVDNREVAKLDYYKDTKEQLVLDNFNTAFHNNGEQNMRVVFENTGEALPYSVNIQWYTRKPQSDTECKVRIQTSMTASEVKVNETVRLTVTLRNKAPEGLPMVIAVVGLPAGLSVQPWQLREMQEKKVIDFYETQGGNLVIYYREMAPNGLHQLNFDLKAEIPGTYTGAASAAYLYYTNEHKDWVHGNSITIH